jgi:large-conductance mechanosensitive channel
MILVIGITSYQLTDYIFLWLLFLFIADLIFIRLKAINKRKQEIEKRKIEELMATRKPWDDLNLENQYGGEV